MDRKLSGNPEIERLIRISESARSCLQDEAISLRRRLDVPARVRDSLKSHPMGWVLGSLGSGLVASLLFRRKAAPAASKAATTSHRGRFATLLGLGLTAAQPLLKAWLTRQLTGYLARRSDHFPASQETDRHPF